MRTLKASALVVMGLMTLALIAGCSKSSNQQMKDAKADVSTARQSMKDAAVDVQAAAREEWLKFKNECETRIAANDKIVAEYKAKMADASDKRREQYDKRIDALEAKNKELRTKLYEYQDGGKTEWEKFHSEFSRDMDELGTAFKDFTVDNTK